MKPSTDTVLYMTTLPMGCLLCSRSANGGVSGVASLGRDQSAGSGPTSSGWPGCSRRNAYRDASVEAALPIYASKWLGCNLPEGCQLLDLMRLLMTCVV